MSKSLLDAIEEINTKEIRNKRDEIEYSQMVEGLYTILHIKGYRTVRNDSGGNEDIYRIEYVNGKKDFIVKYRWRYKQLRSIYNSCRYKYCSEDIDIKGMIYRQSLNQADVFSIMLEVITNLRKFKFSSEGQLVSYLKKRISGACQNEFDKINKIYDYNNFKLYSYDHIIEELVERVDMSDKYDSYTNMIKIEFDYNKNKNVREIDIDNDAEEYRKNVYFSWAYSFWDENTILNDKMLNIRDDNYKKRMNKLKEWKEWATDKQKEKVELLLKEIEQGEDLFIYSNKGYVLNLKKVGEILYPNRNGNANKDIYNLIDSFKNRFNKYIA